MGRPPRKEREKAQHRREILDAAEEVFAEKGFHGATTEEIARRAEFAVGTLYKFFKSKEEIYTAVIVEGLNDRLEAVTDLFSRSDLSPRQVVELYIEGKARYFTEHAAFVRLFLKEHMGGTPALTADFHERVLKLYEDFVTVMEKVFRKGVRDGEFRNLPPRDMAIALEGVTNSFLHDSLHGSVANEYVSRVPVMKQFFFEGVVRKPQA